MYADGIGCHMQFTAAMQPQRHISIYMTYRRCEDDRIVVVRYGFVYRLFHAAARHGRVVVTVRELTYNQSAQVSQYAAHTQIAHHTVNMVMALSHILYQQYRKLVTQMRQAIGSGLQPVQDRQVSSHNGSAGVSAPVERMRWPCIMQITARECAAQTGKRCTILRQRSNMFAHYCMQ